MDVTKRRALLRLLAEGEAKLAALGDPRGDTTRTQRYKNRSGPYGSLKSPLSCCYGTPKEAAMDKFQLAKIVLFSIVVSIAVTGVMIGLSFALLSH